MCQIETEILSSEVERQFYSLFCLWWIVFVCYGGRSCLIPRPRLSNNKPILRAAVFIRSDDSEAAVRRGEAIQ